jgi:pimeloyl-ACP methyl ester carboxylesterase
MRVAAIALLLLPVLTGCFRPPIKVVRLSVQDVQRELTANVLSAGRPSTASRIVLQRRGLDERYDETPEVVIAALHEELSRRRGDRDLTFALAELSFHRALEGGGREHYLASALYAWDVLFATGAVERDGLDPRGRLSADLYNVGLARAFVAQRTGKVELRSGPRRLPYGTLDVTFDPNDLRWGDRRLVDLMPASELGVRGIRNRYRAWGIGAPLNASPKPLDGRPDTHDFVFPNVRVAVTMLLRPARDGKARLELYSATDRNVVDIDGRAVPLEYEPTSALADTLATAPIWKMEFAGFLRGDFIARERFTRLAGIAPFHPRQVPVVLVHGTVSSPGRWAQMVNDLSNDHELRRRYQLWAFSYDSGNPILYSAMQLRESLSEAVQELDPRGESTCLRQMVVIGHSQGGLLAKLTAVESGDRFWRDLSDRPFDDVRLSDGTRQLLRRAMFVSPLPFVRRLVFIATPHGGSYRAQGLPRRLVQRLMRFPSDLTRVTADLVTGSDVGKLALASGRMPTAVDNMAPSSTFITSLRSLDIAPDVPAHSIIPVKGGGAYELGNDGVVRYASAHLGGVESELVVQPCAHSTQAHPNTIEEVRRILLEHASRVFEGDDCRPPVEAATQ